jgi:hypothetical protein
MLIEQDERNEDRDERLRLALLAINPTLSPALFPGGMEPQEDVEELVEEPVGDVDLHREDTDYDFRKVEWARPDELGDDDFAMLSKMLGNDSVTVSGSSGAPEGVEPGSGLRAPSNDEEWI